MDELEQNLAIQEPAKQISARNASPTLAWSRSGSQLRDGEAILAYLDDTYIVSSPERVCQLYEAYRRPLWAHAHVALNRSKTRVWNAASEKLPGISALQLDQDAQVWVGDWGAATSRTGDHGPWHTWHTLWQ